MGQVKTRFFLTFLQSLPPRCQVLGKMINAVKFEYNGSYVVCNNLTHYAMLKGLDVSGPDRLLQLQFRGEYLKPEYLNRSAIHITFKVKTRFFFTFLFFFFFSRFPFLRCMYYRQLITT